MILYFVSYLSVPIWRILTSNVTPKLEFPCLLQRHLLATCWELVNCIARVKDLAAHGGIASYFNLRLNLLGFCLFCGEWGVALNNFK